MDPKVVIPLLVSSLALGVSFGALYFSQLRAAAITITAGEHANIWYFPEGNCAATLPINVANNGARTAVVRRLALLIQDEGSTEGYLFEPLFYDRIDEDGDFQHESQPHPIAVPARSTETKQILFRSSLDRPDEFRFRRAGSYRFTVVAWLKNSVKPQAADTFCILITEANLATLEKYRAENLATSVRVQQSEWRKWGAHKLTEVETAALGVNPV